MRHGELRSYRGSRLVNEFFLQFSSFNLNDTFKTGESFCGTDSYPVTVSSKHVERQERGDLFSSGTPEEQLLTKPTKKSQN